MEEPRRLGGRYELGSVLGRGGMAEVYLAHDTRLGRSVAVKTLRVDLARDPSFQARFRREAQSAASLNHPSIVAVYDTGEDYVDGISIPYIVMEYVDGSTLRELLHSGRKLLPERSLEMTVGILQALEYSHRAGIVHRDIKPANVMLTRNGQVKVMDFGIARAMGDSGMTMTQTSAVIGTAQYLSPEQAKGEQVDARSDLYSAGCLLYELLTVRPPFVGDSPVAVAYQHVREDPQPPSVWDPEITPEMDAIVLKALAKDPDYRYQSADEMRADIESYLDGQPVGATAAMGSVGYGGYGDGAATTALPSQNPATSMLPPVRDDDGGYGYDDRPDRRRQKKNHTSTVLLVLAGILVLVGAIFLGQALFNKKGAPDSLTAPNLVGKSFADAQSAAANLDPAIKVVKGETKFCDAQPANSVCDQLPKANDPLAADKTITVSISKGVAPTSVPDVVNDKFEDAKKTLEDKGFQVKEVTETSNTKDDGTVTKQDPAGGTLKPKDTVVTLTVAKKPEEITVKDVTQMPLAQAKQTLIDQGLKVRTQDEESADKPVGSIIRQDPAGGSTAQPDQTVTLFIAKAPQQQNLTVPGDLVGKTLKDAKNQLEGMGLKVQVLGPKKDDAVVAQSFPQANQPVQQGGTVQLFTTGGTGGGDNGGLFGN
ncbi:Stk1 family PASTA domain-containing Ser/Thr kinase [Streptomyces sp. So13.3]|uniref:Stk1 family PASTA domain-containing Ser/Thr kinase n=1 Tax=Streptomyces TaxID=1883 RepID=UPI0011073281|nr:MULTISPECIES: Stk1 family PASTA domain-containing Ser/Thr kinase [Streptomyces]MCZ4094836.1 Stk1 family PASTA domain-containing Ser/Thr kinase [Streptomyces sp. H39-C1]QNA74324.1 Stk1 family PASTA domain-containing Ser/Thr kinase [Streptomyces sp. So13.3]